MIRTYVGEIHTYRNGIRTYMPQKRTYPTKQQRPLKAKVVAAFVILLVMLFLTLVQSLRVNRVHFLVRQRSVVARL